MKPIYSTLFLPLLGLLATAPCALAGPANGGGGQAVLCYSNPGVRDQVAAELTSVGASALPRATNLRLDQLEKAPIMADLYNGERIGLMNSAAPVLTRETPGTVYDHLAQVDPEYMNLLKPYITTEDQWHGYSSGVVSIADSTFVANFPNNCLLAQVAFYDDANKIVNYNIQIVDLMDDSSRTALKLHEDNYKLYRETAASRNSYLPSWATEFMVNVNSSNSVRPLVAYLMTHESVDAKAFADLGVKVAVGIAPNRCGIPLKFWATQRTVYKKQTVTTFSCGA